MIGESEWNMPHNRKEATRLRAKGYRIESDIKSYRVWYGEEFIHGASALNASKHWKHRAADLRMNFFLAVLTAKQHEERSRG